MAKTRRAKHAHSDRFCNPRQLDDQTQELQALLDEARAGSDKARDELIERHRQKMIGYFTRRLSDRLRRKTDEQDLTQIASFKAWQTFGHFVGQTLNSYWAWLRQICYSLVQRLVRTFHQDKRDIAREELLDEPKLDDGSQHPFGRGQRSPAEIVEAVETSRQLQAALDKLPDDDERQIVVWHLTEGLPFAEIARRLRCSNDAIERAFHRSVQNLKQRLLQPAS